MVVTVRDLGNSETIIFNNEQEFKAYQLSLKSYGPHEELTRDPHKFPCLMIREEWSTYNPDGADRIHCLYSYDFSVEDGPAISDGPEI